MTTVAPREVEVQYLEPAQNLTPGDLTELGAVFASAGLTSVEARGLVAEVQQAAAQVALGAAPKVLEKVRKVQEARLTEILVRIRLLPNAFGTGYVSRDRVLQIIQDVYSKTPTT